MQQEKLLDFLLNKRTLLNYNRNKHRGLLDNTYYKLDDSEKNIIYCMDQGKTVILIQYQIRFSKLYTMFLLSDCDCCFEEYEESFAISEKAYKTQDFLKLFQ